MGGRRDATASAKTAAAGAVLRFIYKIAGHDTRYFVSCPAALSSLGRKKSKCAACEVYCTSFGKNRTFALINRKTRITKAIISSGKM